MKRWLGKRPWIWIIVFFIAFMGAWTGLIMVAVNNSPEPLEEVATPTEQTP